MMPSVRPTWEVDLAGIARLRACVTALAVERYRLAKGKLPDGLGDLVGEYLESVPADPFTGQMLKYKKLQQGYVVYSVGKDGKDDGGVEQEGLILFLRLGSEGKDAQSALDIHYLTYMGGKLSGFLPSHK